MSKKLETAHAGTLESSDAFVRVIPIDAKGIEIELESTGRKNEKKHTNKLVNK
jgi:citrate lyase subunit gamma (acyl carrier protein)